MLFGWKETINIVKWVIVCDLGSAEYSGRDAKTGRYVSNVVQILWTKHRYKQELWSAITVLSTCQDSHRPPSAPFLLFTSGISGLDWLPYKLRLGSSKITQDCTSAVRYQDCAINTVFIAQSWHTLSKHYLTPQTESTYQFVTKSNT